MSVESTRMVMMNYWDSNHADVSMLADDVVYKMMATGEETHTPQGVLAMLNYFYHIAFDATATTDSTIIGDGKAVLEGHVVGKHIGEFAGIPATGKEFRVPICICYDVENDKIQRARIYFELPALFQQLGVAPGMAQAQE